MSLTIKFTKDESENLLSKLHFLMCETEKLLQKNEKLTCLNNTLLTQIRNLRSRAELTSSEYDFFIDMIVINQMKYEEELYLQRKILNIKNSFCHESPL